MTNLERAKCFYEKKGYTVEVMDKSMYVVRNGESFPSPKETTSVTLVKGGEPQRSWLSAKDFIDSARAERMSDKP